MIKIAFFDIDGTLLKMGNKEPTDKTVKALNSLRQNIALYGNWQRLSFNS